MTSQKSDETCEDLTWDGKVVKDKNLVSCSMLTLTSQHDTVFFIVSGIGHC